LPKPLRQGQDDRSVLHDRDGVLAVRGTTTVGAAYRPAVGATDVVVRTAEDQHRLASVLELSLDELSGYLDLGLNDPDQAAS